MNRHELREKAMITVYQYLLAERDVDEYVKVNIRQGYIVKTMTMSEYSCYVVMEKY